MVTVKNIINASVFTAILIVSQLALSAISGVEIVTVLFLSFCYKYGVRQGLFVANAFSLLRCFLFGFNLNVIILYLVYYNVFALIFGFIGNVFGRAYSIKKHAVIVVVAVITCILFTLFDNVITPLVFGFTLKAAKVYFFASLYTVIPHAICVLVTTLTLFPVLLKVLKYGQVF